MSNTQFENGQTVAFYSMGQTRRGHIKGITLMVGRVIEVRTYDKEDKPPSYTVHVQKVVKANQRGERSVETVSQKAYRSDEGLQPVPTVVADSLEIIQSLKATVDSVSEQTAERAMRWVAEQEDRELSSALKGDENQ